MRCKMVTLIFSPLYRALPIGAAVHPAFIKVVFCLFLQVMDANQTFKSSYCGAFTFKFFVVGEWREVVVDDRLPTLQDRRPLFVRSGDENEFWPCLLEKAFAKIYGFYSGLNGGSIIQAAKYFGAVSERFEVKGSKYPNGLEPEFAKERVLEALRLGSLCSTGTENDDKIGSLYGLPSGHAYTITGGTEEQVQVRNPWGDSTEWTKQTSAPDGEFWILWDDFFTHFHEVRNFFRPSARFMKIQRRFVTKVS